MILAGRDVTSGKSTCDRIIKESGNRQISFIHLDLSSLDSVNGFVTILKDRKRPLYCLVNNAGCFYLEPSTTKDGLERTYQTNYLSAVHLTLSLLPLLSLERSARIINLSSQGHLQAKELPDLNLHQAFEDTPANRFRSYLYSKLCLVTFSCALKKKLDSCGSHVAVHCVNPGNTETKIYRNFPYLSNPFRAFLLRPIRYFLVKTPREGAQGILHAILKSPPVPFYIEDARESLEINPLALDEDRQQLLWRRSWQECSEWRAATADESFLMCGVTQGAVSPK